MKPKAVTPRQRKPKRQTTAPAASLTDTSRRGFLKGTAGLLAGAVAIQVSPTLIEAQRQPPDSGLPTQLARANANGRPILLKDGIIYTVDWQRGDFEKGDVLIQGKKIVAVGPKLESPKSALVVNAAGMIVMPGLIDTHHHQSETVLRSILTDGVILTGGARGPKNNYESIIRTRFNPVYTPEDAYAAELLASISQINDGVTTTVDTSKIQLTPEHTDACIAGLKESGRRAIFSYSADGNDPTTQFPSELSRLRKQYFSSSDQLLTLGASGDTPEMWRVARSLDALLAIHLIGTSVDDFEPIVRAGLMGPDCLYIHCTRLTEEMWKRIADTGGKVSIAPATEMQMRYGEPAFQQALDHALGPSLSVDGESSMTADMFSVMRAALATQHEVANERMIASPDQTQRLVTCREVIEFATVYGAVAIHLFPKIGAITAGKEADIIMLATDRVNTFPLNNVPGAVVTLMDTSNVENVFIAGKVMKWHGQLVGVDLAHVRAQAEKSADGLLARAKHPRDLFSSCCLT